MADGHPAGYRELMNTEVVEFYHLYLAWKNRMDALTRATGSAKK
jgi:hypothetical protein